MTDYDTICLSGGGIKGLSYIGALDYLENHNFIKLSSIKNWVGTSVGSIFSFIFSLGYNVQEIGDFILDFNFSKLEPELNLDNLLLSFGVNNGDKLMFIITSFLKSKFNISDITFEEHFNKTHTKLIIIGTNYSRGCESVFNYLNTPKMSVLTAIRISISIPVIFTPVFYDNEYYVDGGLVNNFPINHCNPETTLGLFIKNGCCNEMTNVLSLIQGCIGIATDTISIKDCSLENYNIIEIENFAQEFTKFNIDKERKQQIIKLGQVYAKKYLDNLSIKISKSILEDIINKIS
jgi:hypothetical protein